MLLLLKLNLNLAGYGVQGTGFKGIEEDLTQRRRGRRGKKLAIKNDSHIYIDRAESRGQ